MSTLGLPFNLTSHPPPYNIFFNTLTLVFEEASDAFYYFFKKNGGKRIRNRETGC